MVEIDGWDAGELYRGGRGQWKGDTLVAGKYLSSRRSKLSNPKQ